MLYFDRKGDTPGRLGLSDEMLLRWPMRLLIPTWRTIGWPSLETIADGDIDLFYAPDLYFPPSRKTTILTTVRGIAWLAIPEHCAPRNVSRLSSAFNYARQHADYFLAVSESTRQDILALTDIPADRIFVSSHGVDPKFAPVEKMTAREHVRRRYGVERPFFLFVGAVSSHKNVRLLVDALSLSHVLKEVDLVLAGPHEEPFTASLRKHVEAMGLSSRVHLIGPVEQEGDELTYLYSAAIALLFPTFYEGWCAPPLEAMRCATPVISTQIPSVREVTDGAAVLLPVDDPEAWCVEMERMVTDTAWYASLVRQGLEHVRQHTWENSANRLLGIMKEIIAREAGG